MKITIKAYDFMNNLFITKKTAECSAEGWKHKESVQTVFVSIDENDLDYAKTINEINELVEFLESLNLQRFETFEQAEESTIEWNEWA